MGREQLVREAKREALARMEDAARTEEDFKDVIVQWDKLDENRERRERYYEISRTEKTLEMGYSDGLVFPIPFLHLAWREAIKGEFLSMIFGNPKEMWQLIDDPDIPALIKSLTDKQKEALFLRVVMLCTSEEIASCQNKTDRAVRKLYFAALGSMRVRLAPVIRGQIKAKWPHMTLAKREFIAWYDKKRPDVDGNKS